MRSCCLLLLHDLDVSYICWFTYQLVRLATNLGGTVSCLPDFANIDQKIALKTGAKLGYQRMLLIVMT